MAPKNVTEDGVMQLATNTVPSEPMQHLTPSATAAEAGKVSSEPETCRLSSRQGWLYFGQPFNLALVVSLLFIQV